MSAGRTTAAREIAELMNTKWGVTWVTPLIVQIFLVISKPLREGLYAFLQSQKAALNIQKAKVVRASFKGDGLAEQLVALQAATAIAAQPINQLLKALPLDTIINEIPEAQAFLGDSYKDIKGEVTYDSFKDSVASISTDFSSFLGSLTSFLPVKIPLSAISNTFGSNYAFFDGVTNFQDLVERVEELEFRLARATALSSYAQAGSSYIDHQLRKLDVYLDIILTVNTSNI